jgi:glycosyltransferase involved in cell wall biosynthesis
VPRTGRQTGEAGGDGQAQPPKLQASERTSKAPAKEDPLLSVVMPAHDEEAYLAAAVTEMASALRARGEPFEVIVAENGSTDATVEVARGLERDLAEVRVLSRPEADYGRALREGFLAATGETVVMFDVDYYDLDFLDRALAVVGRPGEPSVVVGSKRAAGAVDARSGGRRLVTSIFSRVLRLGFGLRVSDTHGMKAMHRPALLPVAESCRFGTDLFDTELVLRAERAGLRVSELPVQVEETRPSRTSISRRIPRTLAGLVRLRLALWREAARAADGAGRRRFSAR